LGESRGGIPPQTGVWRVSQELPGLPDEKNPGTHDPPAFLVLSALLFSLGLYGALARRNIVGILMSIEIMLNAVNIAFVAFGRYVAPTTMAGQVFAIFVVTIAAAEVTVGLAIVLALFRRRQTVDVESMDLMRW